MVIPCEATSIFYMKSFIWFELFGFGFWLDIVGQVSNTTVTNKTRSICHKKKSYPCINMSRALYIIIYLYFWPLFSTMLFPVAGPKDHLLSQLLLCVSFFTSRYRTYFFNRFTIVIVIIICLKSTFNQLSWCSCTLSDYRISICILVLKVTAYFVYHSTNSRVQEMTLTKLENIEKQWSIIVML